MTQLELPPISLGRYLELLKRRSWRVIPTSLAGLVIGGIVAFLIPRYYVAETKLVYQGPVLQTESGANWDPIVGLIANADVSVPQAVPEVLEALGEIGAREDDPARQATIEEFTDRVAVSHYWIKDGRGLINVSIQYKDVDGGRAADFTNTLRDRWTDDVMAQFREQARAELEHANEEVAKAQTARDSALKALMIHCEECRIDLRQQDQGQSGQARMIASELRAARATEADLSASIEALSEIIAGLELTLAGTDKEVLAAVPAVGATAADPAVLKARLDYAYYAQALKIVTSAHPYYESHKARFERAKARLEALVGDVDVATHQQLIPNPRYADLKQAIADRNVELKGPQKRLELVRARIAKLDLELGALPGIWQVYEELRARHDELADDVTAARDAQREMRGRYERAATGHPFRIAASAQVPPAPTEPNITLVALAGCLLGLAAAIGLVLLLDFVRSTFKTVEDVQYAIQLPMLGSMAYLETAEQRKKTVSHRRRVSLVAAVFVFLTLSVVTIYYVAPTRLPPAVLHALDLLLGSES